jgi:uncharacterized protein with GYD domain
MPRYISLIRFTEQGAKALNKSTSRARAFAKAASKKGVRVVGQYWTTGQYDGVLIVEADSEQEAFSALAELSGQGNVRTETMRAFADSEFDAIVK